MARQLLLQSVLLQLQLVLWRSPQQPVQLPRRWLLPAQQRLQQQLPPQQAMPPAYHPRPA